MSEANGKRSWAAIKININFQLRRKLLHSPFSSFDQIFGVEKLFIFISQFVICHRQCLTAFDCDVQEKLLDVDTVVRSLTKDYRQYLFGENEKSDCETWARLKHHLWNLTSICVQSEKEESSTKGKLKLFFSRPRAARAGEHEKASEKLIESI